MKAETRTIKGLAGASVATSENRVREFISQTMARVHGWMQPISGSRAWEPKSGLIKHRTAVADEVINPSGAFLIPLRLLRKRKRRSNSISVFQRLLIGSISLRRRYSYGFCRLCRWHGRRVSLTVQLPPRRISSSGSGLHPAFIDVLSFSRLEAARRSDTFIPDMFVSTSGATSLHGVMPGDAFDFSLRVNARSLARVCLSRI